MKPVIMLPGLGRGGTILAGVNDVCDFSQHQLVWDFNYRDSALLPIWHVGCNSSIAVTLLGDKLGLGDNFAAFA